MFRFQLFPTRILTLLAFFLIFGASSCSKSNTTLVALPVSGSRAAPILQSIEFSKDQGSHWTSVGSAAEFLDPQIVSTLIETSKLQPYAVTDYLRSVIFLGIGGNPELSVSVPASTY